MIHVPMIIISSVWIRVYFASRVEFFTDLNVICLQFSNWEHEMIYIWLIRCSDSHRNEDTCYIVSLTKRKKMHALHRIKTLISYNSEIIVLYFLFFQIFFVLIFRIYLEYYTMIAGCILYVYRIFIIIYNFLG